MALVNLTKAQVHQVVREHLDELDDEDYMKFLTLVVRGALPRRRRIGAFVLEKIAKILHVPKEGRKRSAPLGGFFEDEA